MNDGGSPAVEVIPAEVIRIGQEIAGIHQFLRHALDVTARDVDKLTYGGWTGDAARAFDAGWNDCHRGGTDILATLEALARKLHVAGKEYDAVDTASAKSIDKALNL